ncbi:hypothetical protein FB567DRAFT_177260 [Paraphoma chrysanthemicola]|uniref:Uncharacterized protein n=1 Tax=Paraphoma chrysanthemicola TaxID=798071 RepID=A0A8K0W3R4_9PLEO|nr:hypothetical protein FB567DRAFT_177260 [Paraphoma chrysanthemicola]
MLVFVRRLIAAHTSTSPPVRSCSFERLIAFHAQSKSTRAHPPALPCGSRREIMLPRSSYAVRSSANERARQHYGTLRSRSITWSGKGLLPWRACRSEERLDAWCATQKRRRLARQLDEDMQTFPVPPSGGVAVKSPYVCASTMGAHLRETWAGRKLSAMPRRQGAELVPLRKSREQVVRAVWMKRGVGCLRSRHSSDFICDARGRSAG